MATLRTPPPFGDVIYDSLVASQATDPLFSASFVLSQIEWQFMGGSTAEAVAGATALVEEWPNCNSVAVGKAKSQREAELAAWEETQNMPKPVPTAQEAEHLRQYGLIMAVVAARRSRMRHSRQGLAVKTSVFLDMVGGFDEPKMLTIGPAAIWAAFHDIWFRRTKSSTPEFVNLFLFVNEMVMVSAAASSADIDLSGEFYQRVYARLDSTGVAHLVTAREAILEAICIVKGGTSRAAAARAGRNVLDLNGQEEYETEDPDFDPSGARLNIGGTFYKATSGVMYTTGPLCRRVLCVTDLNRLLAVVTSVCSSIAAIAADLSFGTAQDVARFGPAVATYAKNVGAATERAMTARLGYEPEILTYFPKCKWNFSLAESTVGGNRDTVGTTATTPMWATLPKATALLIAKTSRTSLGARAAVLAGLDTLPVVLLMSFYLGLQLREWMHKTDPVLLAAWSYCPRVMGGLGMPTALELTTSADGAGEGSGTLEAYARINSVVERFYSETLSIPLASFMPIELPLDFLSGKTRDAYVSGNCDLAVARGILEGMSSRGELSDRAVAFIAYANAGTFAEYCALLLEYSSGGLVETID